jgi:hypothetical protein
MLFDYGHVYCHYVGWAIFIFKRQGGFVELCAIGLQIRKQPHAYRSIYGNLCIFHNGKPKVKGIELSHMC